MNESRADIAGPSLPPEERAQPLPQGWLSRWPWIPFLLPMIVFMVLTSFEPTPPKKSSLSGAQLDTLDFVEPDLPGSTASAELDSSEAEEFFDHSREGGLLFPAINYRYYPAVYSVKILLTLATMLLVLPAYRTFPWRVSGLSVAVGVVGVVLWIVLCHLQLEQKLVGPLDRFLGSFIPGLEDGETPSIGLMSLLGAGERSAYNPLEQLRNNPAWAWGFLAIRFFGLAAVVPVIEEFFLRGFLMRFVIHEKWWQVPFGTVNLAAVIAGTAVPMLMHPGELLAAMVWFSMVTWLMVRTRNIWDCVVAHAVTNLLLGVYVVLSGHWELM